MLVKSLIKLVSEVNLNPLLSHPKLMEAAHLNMTFLQNKRKNQ